MEYCDTDLAAILDAMSHSFMEQQSKCLILQLLRALAYIHEMRFLHRDIKVTLLFFTKVIILKDFEHSAKTRWNSEIGRFRSGSSLQQPSTSYSSSCHSMVSVNGTSSWLENADRRSRHLARWLYHGWTSPPSTALPTRQRIQNGSQSFSFEAVLLQISAISDLLGSPTAEIWPDYPNMPVCKDLNLNLNPHNLLAVRFFSFSMQKKVETVREALSGRHRLHAKMFHLQSGQKNDGHSSTGTPIFQGNQLFRVTYVLYQTQAEPRACRPSLIPIIPRKASKWSPFVTSLSHFVLYG